MVSVWLNGQFCTISFTLFLFGDMVGIDGFRVTERSVLHNIISLVLVWWHGGNWWFQSDLTVSFYNIAHLVLVWWHGRNRWFQGDLTVSFAQYPLPCSCLVTWRESMVSGWLENQFTLFFFFSIVNIYRLPTHDWSTWNFFGHYCKILSSLLNSL